MGNDGVSAMGAVGVCGVLLVVWPLVGVGQTAARPSPVAKFGCPATAPPTTSDSVATAVDYVELQRTACKGSCPAYTVRVRGDGTVTWHGEAQVAVMGNATETIDSNDARALMQRLADRGFWGLCGRYERGVSDQPTYVTTVSIAGHVRRVEDYAEGAPSWLRDLDLDVDRVANTHQWRHGGPLAETFGDDRVAVDALMPKAGVTQLMKAAALPETGELVRLLKLLGDVNARDSSGWTALMYAAQAGPVEAMSLLLQAGADAGARSNEGETPLFAAVSATTHGEQRFRLLDAAGVDLNARDNRGVTPLMVACRSFWRPQLVATLLELGADPSKRDDAGKTAVDYLDAAEVGAQRVGLYQSARAMLTRK
jgi:hypothetical protein